MLFLAMVVSYACYSTFFIISFWVYLGKPFLAVVVHWSEAFDVIHVIEFVTRHFSSLYFDLKNSYLGPSGRIAPVFIFITSEAGKKLMRLGREEAFLFNSQRIKRLSCKGLG